MTTSEMPTYDSAFVWLWLPGASAPVVAGRLEATDGRVLFNYGRSYLARKDALPIHLPELPLEPGALPLLNGLSIPGCIRDAAPDAWGRRVILNRTFGLKADEIARIELSELTFLLESGSDRIGALDFQLSATEYVPRSASGASLDELIRSAERVEQGIPLSPDLDRALHHGTSIGGARPKALIEEADVKYIAKFASSTDVNPVVKWEFVAMRMAALCGIDAAPVSLVKAAGKDVILVRRFDRSWSGHDWTRRMMVSALTILGLDEMMARYASYQDLAEIVRHRFAEPASTLRELFARIVFSILCGNTDDHARNHAAFWDGDRLSLTPAYDICPQGRSGQEATQAMLIHDGDRMSRISTCIATAHHFHLSERAATELIESQMKAIAANWRSVCDDAGMGEAERNALVGRQFLNPFAFTTLPAEAERLEALAEETRQAMR